MRVVAGRRLVAEGPAVPVGPWRQGADVELRGPVPPVPNPGKRSSDRGGDKGGRCLCAPRSGAGPFFVAPSRSFRGAPTRPGESRAGVASKCSGRGGADDYCVGP